MILNGVKAQTQTLADFAVRESLGQSLDDLQFTLGKQRHSLSVNCAYRRTRSEGIQSKCQIGVVSPNLTFVHTANALAEVRRRVTLGEDPFGSGAESLHYVISLGRV
jgi:hypothetical protein